MKEIQAQFKPPYSSHTAKANEVRLNNIAAVAKADGYLHEKESSLLHNIGNRLGFTSEAITQIVNNARDVEPVHLKDNSEKLSHVMNIFRVAVADGELVPQELKHIKEVLGKLGYDAKHADELISIARKEIS